MPPKRALTRSPATGGKSALELAKEEAKRALEQRKEDRTSWIKESPSPSEKARRDSPRKRTTPSKSTPTNKAELMDVVESDTEEMVQQKAVPLPGRNKRSSASRRKLDLPPESSKLSSKKQKYSPENDEEWERTSTLPKLPNIKAPYVEEDDYVDSRFYNKEKEEEEDSNARTEVLSSAAGWRFSSSSSQRRLSWGDALSSTFWPAADSPSKRVAFNERVAECTTDMIDRRLSSSSARRASISAATTSIKSPPSVLRRRSSYGTSQKQEELEGGDSSSSSRRPTQGGKGGGGKSGLHEEEQVSRTTGSFTFAFPTNVLNNRIKLLFLGGLTLLGVTWMVMMMASLLQEKCPRGQTRQYLGLFGECVVSHATLRQLVWEVEKKTVQEICQQSFFFLLPAAADPSSSSTSSAAAAAAAPPSVLDLINNPPRFSTPALWGHLDLAVYPWRDLEQRGVEREWGSKVSDVRVHLKDREAVMKALWRRWALGCRVKILLLEKWQVVFSVLILTVLLLWIFVLSRVRAKERRQAELIRRIIVDLLVEEGEMAPAHAMDEILHGWKGGEYKELGLKASSAALKKIWPKVVKLVEKDSRIAKVNLERYGRALPSWKWIGSNVRRSSSFRSRLWGGSNLADNSSQGVKAIVI